MSALVETWDTCDLNLFGRRPIRYDPKLKDSEATQNRTKVNDGAYEDLTSDECDGTDVEDEADADDMEEVEKPENNLGGDRIFGENSAVAFSTSGDTCVDFFFQVVSGISFADLWSLFDAAYKQESLTALKLACHLRGVRGTGKGDKTNMEGILVYLRKHHPKTLVANLQKFAEVGYFKDLSELLKRLVKDDELPHRPIEKPARVRRMEAAKLKESKNTPGRRRRRDRASDNREVKMKRTLERGKEAQKRRQETREERLAMEAEKTTQIKLRARDLRLQRHSAENERALRKYKEDEVYRAIHNRISSIFASHLQQDLRKMELGERFSLAAKWCPTVNRGHDRQTLICEAIAVKMFPRQHFPEYGEDMPEAIYRAKVKDRLRKDVLVPLRKKLCMPETFMSAQEWNKLPYNRVPSVAMANYKDFFVLHDKERFEEYLEKVKAGKATIAAGALFPHELVKESTNEVSALQWERMKEDLTQGKDFLQECIAISDVSGSMEGVPMEVSVALGLLISEITMDPWKGKLITFSENPQFHLIPQNASFDEKVKSVRGADWGCNTNLEKVFDLILETAQKENLPPTKMLKTIFIFSDMEFDEAKGAGVEWSTTYEHIVEKFSRAGYPLPFIVFWNLRASQSIPTRVDTGGVALVSGFSKNLIKLFFNNQLIDPRAAMEAAIASAYDDVVVCD